jgi:hypothetical protein
MNASTRLLGPILKVTKSAKTKSWQEDEERFNVINLSKANILPIGHANISCGWWQQGKNIQVGFMFLVKQGLDLF